VLKKPFNNPIPIPRMSMISIPKGNGIPIFFTKMASTHVVSAAAEPGDRSMPAVNITSVLPIAAIATVLTCSETLMRFCVVRNLSVVKLVISTAINSATSGPAIAERKNLRVLFIPDSNKRFSRYSQHSKL
jgi:hypothetical protein